MKERSQPDNFKGTIAPVVFRGIEYQANFVFDQFFEDLPDEELYDGMVVGHNSSFMLPNDQGFKPPKQLLVWEGCGVTAMTERRYKKKYVEAKIK